MKRLVIFIISLCLVLLCGCAKKENNTTIPQENKEKELIGVWLTFSEIKALCSGSEGFDAAFNEVIKNCKTLGINTVFLQVRPFCDAIYKSQYFPQSDYIAGEDEDVLKKAIEIAKASDISIHAWINPYRVATSFNDINMLPDDSPAKIWRTDDNTENDDNVCTTDNGIYLNPAKDDVKKLILNGVREIIENYSVDGIHMDDYFYPTIDTEFDSKSYETYKATVETPLDIGDWRRKNVNGLLNSVYCAVKAKDSRLVFGVSPAADIERCYNTLYADVEGWIGGGYIDYIMPQLYFGFEYPKEEFRFHNLLDKWRSMTENKPVKFYCGLANYKVGTENEPDKAEWNNYDDIIARQIVMLREKKANGFVFFSYSSLFSDEQLNKNQFIKTMEII